MNREIVESKTIDQFESVASIAKNVIEIWKVANGL